MYVQGFVGFVGGAAAAGDETEAVVVCTVQV